MPEIAVSLDSLFDAPYVEAAERAAATGADAIEFFDWEGTDLAALGEVTRDHDLAVAATLAAGAGSNIDDDGPSLTDPGSHERAVADVERSLDAAEAVGADCLIVTTGPEREGATREEQREAVVGVLADVIPAAESTGVTVVLEPLNVTVDHPGYFLVEASQGADVVRAVDSPRVSLLYDVYHQQITEGNLVESIREHVDAIGHVHVADVPGRNEPGTGEINYRTVLAALDDVGYDGYVGCEFFPTGVPEAALEHVVELADDGRADR